MIARCACCGQWVERTDGSPLAYDLVPVIVRHRPDETTETSRRLHRDTCQVIARLGLPRPRRRTFRPAAPTLRRKVHEP